MQIDIARQSNSYSEREYGVGIHLTERLLCDYDVTEKQIMKLTKQNILNEIEIKQLKSTSVIYEKQEECSHVVVSHLQNRKIINIMIVALTQSGKTGTMSAIIKNYLNTTTTFIPIDHIYIITGLSSKEWLSQTKDRLPESLEKRVFHRDNLTTTFADDIMGKKNVLVIIDEIQIAAKERQTLYSTFDKVGFYDKNTLLRNDVKIVEFSATPDGTIYDLINWGEHAVKIQMQPGNGYTSCFDLYRQGRIKQYNDICGYNKKTGEVEEQQVSENMNEIKDDLKRFETPHYHIIRTPCSVSSDIVIDNFKKNIDPNLSFIKYDKDCQLDDINSILTKPPIKDMFIFIKEKLRCAKTLHKKYLGIVYERYTATPDDAVIIQGLIGRGTGYDDNGQSIYYTNKDSIVRYKQLWDTSFEDKTIRWNSKTTKYKNDILESKGTYNNPELINGMNEHEQIINYTCVPIKLVVNNSDLLQELVFLRTNAKRGYKNKFHDLLLTGIHNNSITVYDKNTIPFNMNTRSIKTVRMYKEGENPNNRRFKNFNTAFETLKPVSQSCSNVEYNVDFAKDIYKLNDFVNEVNVLWITFKM